MASTFRTYGGSRSDSGACTSQTGSRICISQVSQPLSTCTSRRDGVGFGSDLDCGLCGSAVGAPGLDGGVGKGGGSGGKLSHASVLGTSSTVNLGGVGFGDGAGFRSDVGGMTVEMQSSKKFTMRSLNDRLASYIKKVQMLEKTNEDLQLKISQFLESRTSPTAQDYSASLSTINDLQAKILEAILLKGTVQINLDNATMAADSFRMKYENELVQRQAVETDISGLKRLLDDIKLRMQEPTVEIDTLNKEKIYLKKNHDEEMENRRSQMRGQIHVKVEAPEQDLTIVLEDIRDHYESIASKNQKELERWFTSKVEILNQEVATSTQTVETSSTEIDTKKTEVQNLELELQSLLAMKSSFEAKLSKTKAFYSEHLSRYQQQVTRLEEQLVQLHADLERQQVDYQMLLDIRSRLELEITEYKRLLDVELSGSITEKSSVTKLASSTDFGITHLKTSTKLETVINSEAPSEPPIRPVSPASTDSAPEPVTNPCIQPIPQPSSDTVPEPPSVPPVQSGPLPNSDTVLET